MLLLKMSLASPFLRPWVSSRRVALLSPDSPEEPRRLLAEGARQVFALDAEFPSETGIEARPSARGMPLRDESVDTILCAPAFLSWSDARRRELLSEARRVLCEDGVMVLWIDPSGGADASLVAELRAVFPHVYRVPVGAALDESRAGERVTVLMSALAVRSAEALVALTDAPAASSRSAPSLEEATRAGGDASTDAPSAADSLISERAFSKGLQQELRPADVLLDRNRLRDELARRTSELLHTEDQLWRTSEEVQKERLENVRLVADIDRLREQVERTQLVERERAAELERLGRELSALESEYADLQGILNARDVQLAEAESRRDRARDGADGDEALEALRAQLTAQREELERARARSRTARDLVSRRERELLEAGEVIQGLRRAVDEHANAAANLRGELDVVKVELDQSNAKTPRLLEQLRAKNQTLSERETEMTALQRNLEHVTGEQQHLRHNLRLRKQEHEELESRFLAVADELDATRNELAAVREANEELERALALRAEADGEEALVTEHSVALWPPDAVAEVGRLREQLATVANQRADTLSLSQQRERAKVTGDRERVRRSQLEARVRAEEQEYMLALLEKSEQRIWEMQDAEGRSAARLAAGLAQLEKQREQYEDLVDELVVTRELIRDERVRAEELERVLATEQAKLARAGIEPEVLQERARRREGASTAMLDNIIDTLGAGEISASHEISFTKGKEPQGLEYSPASDYAEAANAVGVEIQPVAELETSFDLDAELQSILDGDSAGPTLDFSALPVDLEPATGLASRTARDPATSSRVTAPSRVEERAEERSKGDAPPTREQDAEASRRAPAAEDSGSFDIDEIIIDLLEE